METNKSDNEQEKNAFSEKPMESNNSFTEEPNDLKEGISAGKAALAEDLNKKSSASTVDTTQDNVKTSDNSNPYDQMSDEQILQGLKESGVISQQTPESKRMNFLVRFLGIFFYPVKLCRNIKVYPSILQPLIFLFIFSIPIVIVAMPYGVLVSKHFFDSLSIAMPPIPTSQATNIVSVMVAVVLNLIGVFFIVFIMTIVELVINLVLKGSGKFKEFFSANLYFYLILEIGSGLFMSLSILLNSVINVTSLNVLAQNTNMFSFSYYLLTDLSIFNIWFFILLGIGLYVISNFSVKKSVLIAVIIFILFILFSGVTGTISSNFSKNTIEHYATYLQ